MIFPWVKLSTERDSTKENRRLATFPTLAEVKTNGFDAARRQFEEALKDRYTLREETIAFAKAIKREVGDGGADDLAMLGKDNCLFLKETLSDFANRKTFSEDEKAVIAAWLGEIDGWCRERGKRFLFVIGPDKCRIYPELVTDYFKLSPDESSRTEDLVRFLRERGIQVIYSRAELVAYKAKAKSMIYYRYDSHWTLEGSYVGAYLPILDALGMKPEDFSWTQDRLLSVEGRDLVSMTSKNLPDDENLYAHAGFDSAHISHEEPVECGERIIRSRNAVKKDSLFILRDSFMSYALRFLECSIGECNAYWRYTFEPEDAEEALRADVIILETVERHLPRILSCARTDSALPGSFRK